MQTQTKTRSPRAVAGKALAVFLALMALLTLANNTLNELAVAQVDTVSPQRGALERRIDASGELTARQIHPIYAEAAVHVERVEVRVGQTVSEGEALFALKQSALDDVEKDARSALEEAQRSLATAEQSLAYAKADMNVNALDKYETYQANVDKAQLAYNEALAAGVGNLQYRQSVLDSAIRERDGYNGVRNYFEKQAALEEAQRTLDDAQTALEEAQRIAKDATVRAPFDAQVIQMDVQVGATASTASASVLLSPLDGELELVVTISEGDADYVVAGDEASVTVGSETYRLPVLSVSLSATEAGRYELAFLLPADAGRVGMSAEMELRNRTKNYDLLVPLSALRQDNTGYYVYIVAIRDSGALGAQTIAQRADVSVLEKDATRAAVTGGVTQRDAIITRSDRNLSANDRVRVNE